MTVKRLTSIRGVSSAGASYVQSTVVQHSSAAKVKAYLKSYKKYAKDCATFTEPTSGGNGHDHAGQGTQLGQSTVMLQQETAVGGRRLLLEHRVHRRRQARRGRRGHRRRGHPRVARSRQLAKVAAKKMK